MEEKIMDLKATGFWYLLKQCKNVEEVFRQQTCCSDGLTDEQILQLRAERAGLSIEDARRYEEARDTIRSIEAKRSVKQMRKVTEAVCNVIAN